MTVHEANWRSSSADREPEIMESGRTARLHATLAITHDARDLVNGLAEG